MFEAMDGTGTRRLFGTDGIRGRANVEPMTPETLMRVAMAAAARFGGSGHRMAVIAKDTRLSGYLLEPALVCGFTALGWDAVTVGPLPTPAVSVLTRSLRADLGVMLSASHNPFHDNGIKIFGPDGYKLSDAEEQAVEAAMAEVESRRAAPEALGRARRMEDAQGRYIEAVKSSFPQGMRLDGLRIAVDCANGAAYRVAPAVLWELGAEVIPVAVSPDGTNINDACGAAHPETICRAVREHGADIGLSLDGDADRLVLADEAGRPVDGDRVMALIAAAWQRRGRLRGGAVAATVMSNLGLERYLDGIGLSLERTRVGDRYVVEHMRANDLNLGGEQSGHIVLRDFSATGDGLLAALQVLAELVAGGKPASEALALFEPLPQRLENVRYGARDPLAMPAVQRAVADAEVIGESWISVLREALEQGMDLAAGLHNRVADVPVLAETAAARGRSLFDVRFPTEKFEVGNGRKRSGKRILSVGTDCSCGKMYTALALERELRSRGVAADFRATGQTGILIDGEGIAIDAVVSDFISGAVEVLTPDADPDHWDCVEGQGSLFHASYAGVTMGLIHGAQPDALVLCHEPTRRHMRGLPEYPLPELEVCMETNLAAARLTNPAAKFVGAAINTSALDDAAAESYLAETEERLGLPCVDPVRTGVARIADVLP